MTNEEIIAQVAQYEKGLNNPNLPDVSKKILIKKIEELKSQLAEKSAEKEVAIQKEEVAVQEDLDALIAKLEKGLTNTLVPEATKKVLKQKIEDAKAKLAASKKDLAEDKKEAVEEKKEVKEAVKEVEKLAKVRKTRTPKEQKVAKIKIPKVEEKKREEKSKERKTKLKKTMTDLERMISKNKELKAKYAGVQYNRLENDSKRPAKPFGYRFRGKNDYRDPKKVLNEDQFRKAKKRGILDYEGRADRADKFPNGVGQPVPTKKGRATHLGAQLEHGGDVDFVGGEMEDGGMMAHGGEMMARGGNVVGEVGSKYKIEMWDSFEEMQKSGVANYDPHGISKKKGNLKSAKIVYTNSEAEIRKMADDNLEKDGAAKLYEKRRGKYSNFATYLGTGMMEDGMMARGGKVGRKKYTYIPQDEIESISTWNGVSFEGDDILDGAYIKGSNKKYADGGVMEMVGQNDLEELSSLMADIKNQISRYSHVSNYLPKKLLNEIDNFDSIILRELYKYDDEYARGGKVDLRDDAQRFAKPSGWRWKEYAVTDGIVTKNQLAKSPTEDQREEYPEYVYYETRKEHSDKKPSYKYKSI